MNPQPGDIIGFLGNSGISRTICIGTGGWPFWPYLGLSHVGIMGESHGKTLLFESTTLCDLPCAIQGKPFRGTQAHPLEDRVATYPGRIWHYPLSEPLWDNERERLNAFLLEHIGADYDKFAALFAADLAPSWVESYLNPEHRDSCCSVWACAAHAYIGRFSTSNVGRWSPTRFCRAERRQGLLAAPVRLK